MINDLKSLRNDKCLAAPRLMQIEITTACPLSCPQCYKDGKKAKSMSLEMFREIIDDIVEFGVHGVVLIGGEPLIHKRISEMIEISLQKGMSCSIFTSGFAIDNVFAAWLRHIDEKYPDKFNMFLSMNGSSALVHDRSRSRFDMTKSAGMMLKMAGVTYRLNWVARQDNLNDFPNMIKLRDEIGARQINIVCNKIDSHGKVISALESEDYISLLAYIKREQQTSGVIIQNCYDLLNKELFGYRKMPLSGCQAGISFCSMTVDGMYVPCLHLNYREEYDSIRSYWQESPILLFPRLNIGLSNSVLCER